VRSRRTSRHARTFACALALVFVLDASAQYRSPAHTAAPRNIGDVGCRLNTRPLDFGAYEDGSPVAVLTTATMELTCRNGSGVVPVVTAGPSANSGDTLQRFLANGDSRLQYQVYIEPSHNLVWGDGTRGTYPVVVTGQTEHKTFTVYGALFLGQHGEVGRYRDTLQITVEP